VDGLACTPDAIVQAGGDTGTLDEVCRQLSSVIEPLARNIDFKRVAGVDENTPVELATKLRLIREGTVRAAALR
jgi:hypothetical protein